MPTASTSYRRTLFPATFYLDLMAEIRVAAREDLVATKPERLESLMRLRSPDLPTELTLTSPADDMWNLTDEAINATVAGLFTQTVSSASTGSIINGATSWDYPSYEELFTALRQPHDGATFKIVDQRSFVSIVVREAHGDTSVIVTANERTTVQRFLNYFADAAPKFETPLPVREPVRPRIFIGHGGSPQWQTLKTYLHDQMGYEVEAYETLPRAGYDIKEVLEQALANNNFALLVMTAEDEQADHKTMRARQNVVHEAGLFQGHLGFKRAIVVLEEGAEEFSNIAGVQQLRFPAGQISAVHGDVVATLRREFGA